MSTRRRPLALPAIEPAEVHPPMNQTQAAAILAQGQELIDRLKSVACLPEDHWPQKAKSIIESYPALGFSISDLDSFRGEMLIEQIRLGRTVQPCGDLDPLAPIIGAIRTKSSGVDHAVQFLLNETLAAIRNGDKKTFIRIAKLSASKDTKHPNLLIWNAIFELMAAKSETAYNSRQGMVVWQSTIPDTREVRLYVLQQQLSGRFTNLPTHDKSWTRLWIDSGADMIIQKSTRGKGRT